MTDEARQKLAEINAFLNPPVDELLPLPPQANRDALNSDQQKVLFSNWCDFIYSRDPQTWTPDEKAAIHVAAMRALKEPR